MNEIPHAPRQRLGISIQTPYFFSMLETDRLQSWGVACMKLCASMPFGRKTRSEIQSHVNSDLAWIIYTITLPNTNEQPRSFMQLHGHDSTSDGKEDSGPSNSASEEETERNPDTAHIQGPKVKDARIIVQTAFDTYFAQMAARANTSNNVFSNLVPALSAEEYREAITELTPHPLKSDILSESSRNAMFKQMMLELSEGFNLICYGYGSKRSLLNSFATDFCASAGHVIVVNGFQPDFSLKELLVSVERLPGMAVDSLSSSNIENQTRRITEFFSKTSRRHLYLVIHNIDSPSLRTPKAKSCLSRLALTCCIHIVASVDHINSPLLWSASENFARKDDSISRGLRGFSWLWHDLTTLAPYDFELSYADRSSISGAHGRKTRETAAAGMSQTVVSETSAMHVLASVNDKAKRLFMMMGNTQIDAIEQAGDTPASDMQQYALGYNTLFNMARDNFIATNDTALRALLGEFRDHGLVQTSQGGSGGEALWIPLRKDRLLNVLGSIKFQA